MQEKKNQKPGENIQMMRYELCEDDPSINIVMRSGIATGEEKVVGKQPVLDLWFQTSEKNVGFDLHSKCDVHGGKKKFYGSMCFYV